MPTTISDLYQTIKAQLADARIDKTGMDASRLLEHALDLDATQLLIQANRILTAEVIGKVQSAVERRLNRESVARIIGECFFWQLRFRLNEATAEPRPESGVLIEVACKTLDKTKAICILDLGTGTGCLLLSLLHEFPNATGLGVDSEPRAVKGAAFNAGQLGLGNRVTFKTGDWLQDIDGRFDAIIANPINTESADRDGLDAYRTIIPQLQKHMQPRGHIYLEVGEGQAKPVTKLLKQSGFTFIETHKDAAGIERCVAGVFAHEKAS